MTAPSTRSSWRPPLARATGLSPQLNEFPNHMTRHPRGAAGYLKRQRAFVHGVLGSRSWESRHSLPLLLPSTLPESAAGFLLPVFLRFTRLPFCLWRIFQETLIRNILPMV